MTTVTMQTLVERINERLAQQSQKLITTDPEHFDQSETGDYILKDTSKAATIDLDVDPVRLGRELGVLHETERVKG